ncbi:ABC transporter permease [[Clostridium] polysaccharolyticum]|uniref:ABC-2 type transport system permease protein n=1 Tax=[Clostridium] polysaccharolyticum TaxID=29364 RepID=A0A1H9Y6Z9_9FIRM|nr:ABC-2 family transporter protein [[Clostridium] polysaccharolyticum]SES64161.1 ABC-2 type transport system permease protein [[Clostridium] polysaccharolyticum]
MMVYKQAFSLGMQKAMRYRANFWMDLLSFVFPLCIQYFMWTGIYGSSRNQVIYGYTLGQMLVYAVYAAITSRLVSVSFVGEVNNDIKQGGFAKYLVRPVNYLPYQGACFLGEKIMNLIFATLLMIGISIFFILHYGVQFTLATFLFYYFSLILAMILNYFIYICFCSAGFWMKDGSGAIFIMTLVGNIVSGGIFPIDIFSKNIQTVLRMLPFTYTTYFPVSIIDGNLDQSGIIRGFALQAVWIVAMCVVTDVVWKKGVKSYTAVGG